MRADSNGVGSVALFYGAAKLGAVAVPINTRLAAGVSFILSDSGSLGGDLVRRGAR